MAGLAGDLAVLAAAAVLALLVLLVAAAVRVRQCLPGAGPKAEAGERAPRAPEKRRRPLSAPE